MAAIFNKPGLLQQACIYTAFAALLFAAACTDGSTGDSPDRNQPAVAEEETPVQASDKELAPRTPVIESQPQSGAEASRSARHYALDWSGDNICQAVLGALNEPHAIPNDADGYAERQARLMLSTEHNVEWILSGDGIASATLDYFNDGDQRRIERRSGRLSGNRTITLWVEDDTSAFTRLDYGHAGANTAGFPDDYDNLHTRLTYSVADILNIGGRHITLVAPLMDFDASGAIFAVSWQTKNGVTAPFKAQDYYPYIACVMTPAKEE